MPVTLNLILSPFMFVPRAYFIQSDTWTFSMIGPSNAKIVDHEAARISMRFLEK